MPRDVAHLLTDVVVTLAACKGLQLGLDVGSRLPPEPRASDFMVDAAVTRFAGRNVTQRCAAEQDKGCGDSLTCSILRQSRQVCRSMTPRRSYPDPSAWPRTES